MSGVHEVPRVLIAGAPGSGKTTFVRGVVRKLQARRVEVGGFTTQELRERGERTGFLVEAIGGGSAVLANVALAEGPRVGRYRVDVRAFEGVALPALERAINAGGLVVADELGQMELLSGAFIRAVDRLFEQAVPVMATVHVKAHPVTDALKRRPDVELLTLTREAHNVLLARLVADLTQALANSASWSTEGPHRGP